MAPLGSLVVASEMIAADLGAETPEGFRSAAELGFGSVSVPADRGTVQAVSAALAAAGLTVSTGTVLTVSTATGTAETSAALIARHPGAVAEAMEGHGVAVAAEALGLPVLELRAISNGRSPRPGRLEDRRCNGSINGGSRYTIGGAVMTTELNIAFSPCPNDTFVFHAWAHGLVPNAPQLNVTYADIDITNTLAANGEDLKSLKSPMPLYLGFLSATNCCHAAAHWVVAAGRCFLQQVAQPRLNVPRS